MEMWYRMSYQRPSGHFKNLNGFSMENLKVQDILLKALEIFEMLKLTSGILNSIVIKIFCPWKGTPFFSYIKKVAFKRHTPVLETPDRIDLVHLKFQSDSSENYFWNQNLRDVVQAAPPLLLACVTEMASHSAGFSDIQVTLKDPQGISQVGWNQWKPQIKVYSSLPVLPNTPKCFRERARTPQKPSLPRISVQASLWSIIQMTLAFSKSIDR